MKYTSVKKDPPTRPSSSPSPSSSSPSSKKEIGDYKIKHVNSLEVLRVNSEKQEVMLVRQLKTSLITVNPALVISGHGDYTH